MVVPIKRMQADELTHLLEWVLEKVGLYTPPPREVITILESASLSPELRETLKERTGNDYEYAVSGFSNDGIIGLVRKDSSIESMQLIDDKFMLCSASNSGSNAAANACTPGDSCSYFSMPDNLIAEFRKLDASPAASNRVEVAGVRNGDKSVNEKVAGLYFSLAPGLRDVLQGVDPSGLTADPWMLSSIGIARIDESSDTRSFFEDVARARLFRDGAAILDRWNTSPDESENRDDSAAVEEVAKLAGMIYSKPEEAKEAIAGDRLTAKRAALLAEFGYLRDDQKNFLFDSSGKQQPLLSEGYKPECDSLSMR